MEKANIRFVFIFVTLTCAFKATGQDAIFSQHFSTPTYLNPAFAGTYECTRLVFNYRNQPYPDFGTFSTFNFSYDQPVEALMGGLGILATSDHQGGLIMRNHISAIYSLHLRITRDLHLNFGAQAGYLRKDLNWNNLVFPDQFDPATGETLPITETPPGQTWRHAADFAAGILLYNERFYGGAAIHHLTRPEESLFGEHPLPIKFTAHLGFHIPLGQHGPAYQREESFFFSPNIIFQHQAPFNRINYGLYAGVSKIIAGVWLRQDFRLPETLIFMLGLNQGKYRVAYSYDHSLSGFSGIFHGAHEISVLLNLHCKSKNLRYRILNCPSF
ncbi:MAG: PorP/SprF family type IX secretion system membrane protein [Bacteroidales bacterium]|jgi:type IX secretion system PorP/SprF family membrane protein|nr:PorP/SprF family type IX secretion system membrane protein [Bacteroidales bacterium]NLM93566.1 PorP/SprF family type IX secretion system membrane protein [Bacteroidales bacterium]